MRIDWEKWDQPTWPMLIGLVIGMSPAVALIVWAATFLPATGCSG